MKHTFNFLVDNDKMEQVKSMKKLLNLRYFFSYLSDPRVPFIKKIWIYFVLIYFLSPIDLIPEPFLGFGLIDDAFILFFSLIKILNDLDEYAKSKNGGNFQANPEDKAIDIEYKVHDD